MHAGGARRWCFNPLGRLESQLQRFGEKSEAWGALLRVLLGPVRLRLLAQFTSGRRWKQSSGGGAWLSWRSATRGTPHRPRRATNVSSVLFHSLWCPDSCLTAPAMSFSEARAPASHSDAPNLLFLTVTEIDIFPPIFNSFEASFQARLAPGSNAKFVRGL